MTSSIHIPVLQKEVLQYLDPKPNENFIDCTIGLGGHATAILEKTGPKGKLLGIDADPKQIENCKPSTRAKPSTKAGLGAGLVPHRNEVSGAGLKIGNFRHRVILVCDNFANLREIATREKFKNVSGILFDLGMSNWHLKESGRGFSFLKNELLDMRYNPENPLTAEKILNYWSGQDIEKILREYGEERFAVEIAREVLSLRPVKTINTTTQLVEIIQRATPKWYQIKKIHPATKTFQALRIAVNDELNNLKRVLPQALEILKKEGKLVIVSFHSLEDRIVKNFLKEKGQEEIIKILTKKPITPSFEEIKINPRSRSAKLRAAIKI